MFAGIGAGHSNQNYTAILSGEGSGNRTAPTASVAAGQEDPLRENSVSDAVDVMLPVVSGGRNQLVTVPVTVGDLTGRGVTAYQFDLLYDPNVFQPAANPATLADTLSS